MSWTWDEINSDWLLGNKLALPSEIIVEAFNRAETVLGSEWIGRARARGTSLTLHVATVGQFLASLEGVSNTDELIGKLRAGDASALAELEALHLIKSKGLSSVVELGPSVQIGDRIKKPDFRIRQGGERWTYVEVTQTEVAEAQIRAEGILNRLVDLVLPIKKSFTLEIFLRREPTDEEISFIAELVPGFCQAEGDRSQDMTGLAILTLNASSPGYIFMPDHPGEPNVPRLGVAKVVAGAADRIDTSPCGCRIPMIGRNCFFTERRNSYPAIHLA